MDDSSPTADVDVRRARDLLQALLTEAGSRALERQKRVEVTLKDDGSPVTPMDASIDAWLAQELPRAFPGVGVIGEEGASETQDDGAGVFWVDPIDGTQSYIDGLPYWGPTVTLVRGGRVVFGAFYAPALDEFWFGAPGVGAWRSGRSLAGRLRGDGRWAPNKQVLFVPSRFHRGPRVPWAGKLRSFGSTAAHLALVAAGAGVAVVVPRWELWDVGCGVALIREAGGIIRGLDGAPVDVVNGPRGLPFVAGASSAVSTLVEQIRAALEHKGEAERTHGEG
jgi:myo-inositol-1(or 4)-monophosphatase